MSRAKTKSRERAPQEGGPDLVGTDFAERGHRPGGWRSTGVAVVVGVVLGGLLLASLRMTIVRTRYALADSHTQETALLELEREATVELRELRDPRRLRRLAAELGFERPERVIELGTEIVAPGRGIVAPGSGIVAP